MTGPVLDGGPARARTPLDAGRVGRRNVQRLAGGGALVAAVAASLWLAVGGGAAGVAGLAAGRVAHAGHALPVGRAEGVERWALLVAPVVAAALPLVARGTPLVARRDRVAIACAALLLAFVVLAPGVMGAAYMPAAAFALVAVAAGDEEGEGAPRGGA